MCLGVEDVRREPEREEGGLSRSDTVLVGTSLAESQGVVVSTEARESPVETSISFAHVSQ